MEPMGDRGQPKQHVEDLTLNDPPQMAQSGQHWQPYQICTGGKNRMKCDSYVGFSCLPYAAKGNGYRCLEWTLVRRCTNNHNPNIEQDSEYSEGDEDTGDGGIDGSHVFAQSTGEEEERDLEHHRETLDEEVEGPLLEPIALPLTVSATLDHRPASIPQVPVEPLLAQHRDECGEQRDQETRVHESSDRDDLAGRTLLDGWDRGGFIRDSRLVESEEDRTEEGCRLVVGIGLEPRVNVDDKGGADGGEQTRLRERLGSSWERTLHDLRKSRWC